jgi:hypothetical protein
MRSGRRPGCYSWHGRKLREDQLVAKLEKVLQQLFLEDSALFAANRQLVTLNK